MAHDPYGQLLNSPSTPFASSCACCGYTQSSAYIEACDIRQKPYRYRRCNRCQTVFQSPPPTREILSAAYDDSYYGEKESKFIKPVEAVIDYFRSQRARYVHRFLAPGDTVLDVGCGNGLFLKHLSRFGSYKLHGIEPPGKSCDRASRIPGVTIKQGFLTSSDFAPQSLSVATMFHVLEHVDNPSESMENLAKFLKPGGHLILSFPNIQSWQARLFRSHWLHLDPPRHLWFPPVSHFPSWIEEFGFQIVATRHLSLEQNAFGFIQSFLNALSLPRDLLYERLKGNGAYASSHGTFSILIQKTAAALLALPAVIIDAVESLFGRSATIEFTLQRK